MRVTVLAAFLATIGTAAAQDLEPRDYSPFDEVAIRTIGIKPASMGRSAVSIAVANRADRPFDVMAECSIFDDSGQPVASASAFVLAVPPRQEVFDTALTRSFSAKPAKVACRVADRQRTN